MFCIFIMLNTHLPINPVFSWKSPRQGPSSRTVVFYLLYNASFIIICSETSIRCWLHCNLLGNWKRACVGDRATYIRFASRRQEGRRSTSPNISADTVTWHSVVPTTCNLSTTSVIH